MLIDYSLSTINTLSIQTVYIYLIAFFITFFCLSLIWIYFIQVSALKLWYNKSLKESIDKPRIYHQLEPMVVEYEYGTTKVIDNYRINELYILYTDEIIILLFSFSGCSATT